MKFCVLGSGSKGNSIIVTSGKTSILIDAGLGINRLKLQLKEFDILPEQLSGILVTHEHIDHIKAVGTLANNYGVPVYANEKTFKALEDKLKVKILPKYSRLFRTGEEFYIKDFAVRPFKISHDAAEPVGYSVYGSKQKISTVTDLGYISSNIIDCVADSDVLLLEANHDVGMLKQGPYSEYLKRRILGKKGHLSNEDCALALIRLIERNIHNVVLGHLSQENNTTQLAYNTALNMLTQNGIKLEHDIHLELASQDKATAIYNIK